MLSRPNSSPLGKKHLCSSRRRNLCPRCPKCKKAKQLDPPLLFAQTLLHTPTQLLPSYPSPCSPPSPPHPLFPSPRTPQSSYLPPPFSNHLFFSTSFPFPWPFPLLVQ